MNLKKEDFVRIRNFEDRFFWGLRLDFFDEKPLPQEIVEEFEVEAVPTEAELAELKRIEEEQEAKAKLEKELQETKDKLAELQAPKELEKGEETGE